MRPRVLVLGDTLAGLVAAWRLCTADYQVTILTTTGHSGKTIGSFSSPEKTQRSDSPQTENVQPFAIDPSTPLVCYGPHQQTDSLLQELNISKHGSHWRAVPFEFKTTSSSPARFPNTPLPAPWHTVLGIFNFSALTFRQRWHLINFLEKVWEGVATLPNALNLETAESWLTNIGQPPLVQKSVWNPLCRFLLGTSLDDTPAGSFAAMLTQVFFQSRHHGPRISQVPNLSTCLVNGLVEQLRKQGATIEDTPPIAHLQVGPEQVTGVCLFNESIHTADWYISALPPPTLSSCLPERLLARYASFQQMSQTSFTPTVTFHVETDLEIRKPRLILHDGPFSWTLFGPAHFLKSPTALISCVSTNDTTLLTQCDSHIKTCAIETLQDLFANQTFLDSVHPLRHHVVRQPFGFVPHPLGMKPYPLSNQTPLHNLFLAGCWTDTRAITEIESAITSGESCAQAVITQRAKAN